jgi:iron complex outermembrane recepter protein
LEYTIVRHALRVCVLLIVAISSSPFLYAQHCHQVFRGHVINADDNNEPLAFATVQLLEVKRTTLTDEHGFFAFDGLCPDSAYTVSILHVACEHLQQIVRPEDNVCIDFVLHHHHNMLDEVVVQAFALAPTPLQAYLSVQGSELATGQGINLGETIARLPGVTTLNTGHNVSKPVIQGLHSNRIAIVQQGTVLESQQWGRDHAPEVDPFVAQRITVVKGAAGLKYGVSAMAGAVLLDPAPLREATGMGGWVSAGGYSNGRGGVLAAAADWRPQHHSDFAMRTQVTVKRSGNQRAPDYWLGNTGSAELNFNVIANWRRERSRHTWTATRFDQTYGVLRAAHIGSTTDLQRAIESDTPRNNINVFDYAIDRPKQRVAHNTLKYNGLWDLNEVWNLSTALSWQYNVRNEYDRVRSSGNAATRPQVSFNMWTTTLDMALEHRPIRHWQGGVGVQAQQQLNYVSRGGFVPDYQGWGGSVWAIEKWRCPNADWQIELGGRYDYRWQHATTTGNGSRNLDEIVAFHNWSTAVGSTWQPHRSIRMILHSGLAWRPPTVNELFARGVHHGAGTFEQGDSTLVPEKAWNTNLTLQWTPGNALTTEVTVYRNAIQDFIYLAPQSELVVTSRGSFPAYHFEQTNSILQGIDAQANWRVYRGWSVEAKGSVLRAFKQQRIAEQAREWLPLMPSDRIFYALKWEPSFASSDPHEVSGIGRPYIQVSGNTVWQQTRVPEEGLLKATPARYTIWGAELNWPFQLQKKPCEVGITVRNMTNARYRDYLNFFRFFADEPGFNLGIRFKV